MDATSAETREVIRETLRRVVDDLLFYAEEVEMERLPARDGASALHMVAGMIAIQCLLT